MPARAQQARVKRAKSSRRITRHKKAKNNAVFPRGRFLKLSIIAIFLVGLLFSQSRFWSDKSRLALVVSAGENEHILLIVFDPQKSEITNIYIPVDTQVSVARALGNWKLGSVWELGKNEGMDGVLLSETLTYHFNLPVYAWADAQASGFSGGNIYSNAQAALLPYSTNLKMGDRVRMAWYSIGVKSFKRKDVYLEETLALSKRTLKGGESGYILKSQLPNSIVILFSDEAMSERSSRVAIKNHSGKPYLPKVVAEVLETLGGKVTSTTRESEQDFDCKIEGEDGVVVAKLALILDCEETQTELLGSFDLVVSLGREFGERF